MTVWPYMIFMKKHEIEKSGGCLKNLFIERSFIYWSNYVIVGPIMSILVCNEKAKLSHYIPIIQTSQTEGEETRRTEVEGKKPLPSTYKKTEPKFYKKKPTTRSLQQKEEEFLMKQKQWSQKITSTISTQPYSRNFFKDNGMHAMYSLLVPALGKETSKEKHKLESSLSKWAMQTSKAKSFSGIIHNYLLNKI